MINFRDHLKPMKYSERDLGLDNGHFTILFLAWAYVLSARWSELLPGAARLRYDTGRSARLQASSEYIEPDDYESTLVVDVGNVDAAAARWWAAVVAPNGGWDAPIQSRYGHVFYSPWSVTPQLVSAIVLTENKPRQTDPRPPAASFQAAVCYLSEYAARHGAEDESFAALSAVLLIPSANLAGRSMILPSPYNSYRPDGTKQKKPQSQVMDWGTSQLKQLDQLLTLSCQADAVESLIYSAFYERDVACNVCGAWIAGSFAFMDRLKDLDVLRTLMYRRPTVGFLWLGAFMVGLHDQYLDDFRDGTGLLGKDISPAAWTGVPVSFMQEPVAKPDPAAYEISRADECRLLYLTGGEFQLKPPACLFPPFGSTSLTDVAIEVRRHVQCSGTHGLTYGGFIWDCRGGQKVWQGRVTSDNKREPPLRSEVQWPSQISRDEIINSVEMSEEMATSDKEMQTSDEEIVVDYDHLDGEDHRSKRATQIMFWWLRKYDGFPRSEKAIREHPWIHNFENYDQAPHNENHDDETPLNENDFFGPSSELRYNVSTWLSQTDPYEPL